MAFLDNSGDIILDAVLTDNGRKILAEGDGTFQITKFGLADDEIDYSLYNKLHPSGSSYFDLEILQTPILEAFTDNAAMLKYNLVTYSNLEFLFLPVLLLNETQTNNQRDTTYNTYFICANGETENNNGSDSTFTAVGVKNDGGVRQGFMMGSTMNGGTIIKVDQGLNTTAISATRTLDSELYETSYTIQMDNRLGNLAQFGGIVREPDYVDDDNIAFYTVSSTTTSGMVRAITDTSDSTSQVISGPRGTSIEFVIQASLDLQTSSYLFNQLGGTIDLPNREAVASTSTCLFIDTTIKITGQKTGCSISIPIRYIRLA